MSAIAHLGQAVSEVWDSTRAHVYAGVAGASAGASIFISNVMPFLQFIAVVVSIVAGVASYRASRRKSRGE